MFLAFSESSSLVPGPPVHLPAAYLAGTGGGGSASFLGPHALHQHAGKRMASLPLGGGAGSESPVSALCVYVRRWEGSCDCLAVTALVAASVFSDTTLAGVLGCLLQPCLPPLVVCGWNRWFVLWHLAGLER